MWEHFQKPKTEGELHAKEHEHLHHEVSKSTLPLKAMGKKAKIKLESQLFNRIRSSSDQRLAQGQAASKPKLVKHVDRLVVPSLKDHFSSNFQPIFQHQNSRIDIKLDREESFTQLSRANTVENDFTSQTQIGFRRQPSLNLSTVDAYQT